MSAASELPQPNTQEITDLNVAPGHSESPVLGMIMRAAADPTVDITKMEALIRMHRELSADQAKRDYNEAMNRAQEEIQPVARTVENTQTRSFYAKLEDVDRAIRPIYLKHGFSLSYDTVEPMQPGNVRVECRCSRGGHVQLFHREAPADTLGPKGTAVKTTLHGIGSTETFLRRYLACGVFNVVFKGMDDDGVGANTITEEQVEEIVEKIKLAKLGPKFLAYVKAKSVEETGSLEAAVATIPGNQYRKACVALDEHIAKRKPE